MRTTGYHQGVARCAVLLLGALLAVAAWAAPKNVILMIGDGMGTDSVTAAGAYRYGADYHAFGGAQRLALESLARQYYVTTYSIDGHGYDPGWNGGDPAYPTTHATDSAAAGTALACGVKTYNAAIGVDPRKQPVRSILEIAQSMGKKTGVVSSVPISHATPAAFAAHNESRHNYQSITANMIRVTQPDVIMGAGNPVTTDDPNFKYIAAEDWAAVIAGETPYRLVQSREEFLDLITTPADGKVLGLFHNLNCLPYCGADNANADPNLPTLAEMTRGALTQLHNPDGFFLMVEGGAIDWCNHANELNGCIGETLAFDEAVHATVQWIAAHGGWEDNLLIITADHETGYLNTITPTKAGSLPSATWGLEGKFGSHTNRLVPLYAQGAGSDAFAEYAQAMEDFEYGTVPVLDNTDIFSVMRAAVVSGVRK